MFNDRYVMTSKKLGFIVFVLVAVFSLGFGENKAEAALYCPVGPDCMYPAPPAASLNPTITSFPATIPSAGQTVTVTGTAANNRDDVWYVVKHVASGIVIHSYVNVPATSFTAGNEFTFSFPVLAANFDGQYSIQIGTASGPFTMSPSFDSPSFFVKGAVTTPTDDGAKAEKVKGKGKTCKALKSKYKNKKDRKNYLSVRSLKKNDKKEYQRMKSVYKKYQKSGDTERENISAEELSDYSKYRHYAHYKEYREDCSKK
jgi:hypothetical protein